MQRMRRRTSAGAPDGGLPIGTALAALVRQLDSQKQSRTGRLEDDWERLAGRVVAAHTRPGPLVREELVVYVDSSAWLSQLHRTGRSTLLAALQKEFGPALIRRLRLQLDPGR